ncbi:GNAT family N-acetyltransferase [Hoeflea sp. WL0058]|uniref:GNAT family N-acetyltransferase n=1 Tax=Flavimaribacter sediminis TaxID=2865987 RepID=A0AAE2ZRH4_9HYPH|nr:GNAT family N-acetyltransferase [Flavimaribacter sediminis]MBW8640664.1 GNAT family N-acetyltransferase [Flavimaribacter sediminis]
MTGSPGKGNWDVRIAVDADQPAISSLVRSERLFPYGLGWRTFVVAEAGDRIVGAAQIRNHRDGSRELGSLVVTPGWRNRGVAEAMIDTLLAGETGPVHLVTAAKRALRFRRFGFETINVSQAPGALRRHFWLGQIGGGLSRLFSLRRPRSMVVMRRDGTKLNQ